MPERLIPQQEQDELCKILHGFSEDNVPYCIFGSGKICREILSLVLTHDFKAPDFIADAERNGKSKILGYPIEDLFYLESSLVRTVLLGTNTYQREMRDHLAMLSVSLEVVSFAPELVNRVCSQEEIFISSNGDVYPCCMRWGREGFRIGNVNDEDIVSKVLSFYAPCRCHIANFVPPSEEVFVPLGFTITAELSLFCQAECVFCCVRSPEFLGSATCNYLDALEALICELNCDYLILQGGEVLAQRQSLEWVRKVRERYPFIHIHLVTNGCFPVSMVSLVSAVLSSVIVSFAGFSELSYKTVMGLDLSKTLNFVSHLNDESGVDVGMVFVVGPSNIHELPLFLEWGLSHDIRRIGFSKMIIGSATIDMQSEYWREIVSRVRAEICAVLERRKSCLDGVVVCPHNLDEFGLIDYNYLISNGAVLERAGQNRMRV